MSENEGFVRGFHEIPDADKLSRMSFAELASELGGLDKDSPKYIVIERELKRILAKDQARINRSNVVLGAVMGGVFGLAGVVLGAYLKNPPPPQQVSPSRSVQQVQQGNLTVQPSVATTPSTQSVASQPVAVPAPVKGNAQPSKPGP